MAFLVGELGRLKRKTERGSKLREREVIEAAKSSSSHPSIHSFIHPSVLFVLSGVQSL